MGRSQTSQPLQEAGGPVVRGPVGQSYPVQQGASPFTAAPQRPATPEPAQQVRPTLMNAPQVGGPTGDGMPRSETAHVPPTADDMGRLPPLVSGSAAALSHPRQNSAFRRESGLAAATPGEVQRVQSMFDSTHGPGRIRWFLMLRSKLAHNML